MASSHPSHMKESLFRATPAMTPKKLFSDRSAKRVWSVDRFDLALKRGKQLESDPSQKQGTELAVGKEVVDGLLRKIEIYQSDIAKLNKQNLQMEKTQTELESELERKKEALERAQRGPHQSDGPENDNSGEIEQLEKTLQEREREIEILRKTNMDLEAKLMANRESFMMMQSDRAGPGRLEHGDYSDPHDIGRMLQEKDEKIQKLDKLKSELEVDLMNKKEELETLQEELDSLKEQLQNANQVQNDHDSQNEHTSNSENNKEDQGQRGGHEAAEGQSGETRKSSQSADKQLEHMGRSSECSDEVREQVDKSLESEPDSPDIARMPVRRAQARRVEQDSLESDNADIPRIILQKGESQEDDQNLHESDQEMPRAAELHLPRVTEPVLLDEQLVNQISGKLASRILGKLMEAVEQNALLQPTSKHNPFVPQFNRLMAPNPNAHLAISPNKSNCGIYTEMNDESEDMSPKQEILEGGFDVTIDNIESEPVGIERQRKKSSIEPQLRDSEFRSQFVKKRARTSAINFPGPAEPEEIEPGQSRFRRSDLEAQDNNNLILSPEPQEQIRKVLEPDLPGAVERFTNMFKEQLIEALRAKLEMESKEAQQRMQNRVIIESEKFEELQDIFNRSKPR